MPFSDSVHLNIAHILDALESAVVLILDDTFALPICSDDFVLTTGFVKHCWHLESKKIDVGLVDCFFHRVLTNVIEVAFTQKFA